MTYTTHIPPLCPRDATLTRAARGHSRTVPSPDPPSFADFCEELVPLIGVVPVEGPPVIVLAAPLVLFGLMLAGPFLLLVTFAVLAAALLALAGAAVAAAWSIVHLTRLLTRHAYGAALALRRREPRLRSTPAAPQPAPTRLSGAA